MGSPESPPEQAVTSSPTAIPESSGSVGHRGRHSAGLTGTHSPGSWALVVVVVLLCFVLFLAHWTMLSSVLIHVKVSKFRHYKRSCSHTWTKGQIKEFHLVSMHSLFLNPSSWLGFQAQEPVELDPALGFLLCLVSRKVLLL